MKVYVLMKVVEWENSSNWDVYEDEEMATAEAKKLNEDEDERYGSDVYYHIETHELIKKADAGNID